MTREAQMIPHLKTFMISHITKKKKKKLNHIILIDTRKKEADIFMMKNASSKEEICNLKIFIIIVTIMKNL